MAQVDMRTYHILLDGQVEERDVNALGPLYITREASLPGRMVTHFTVYADQAGLVGLLRHLHGLGFVFVEIRRGEGA